MACYKCDGGCKIPVRKWYACIGSSSNTRSNARDNLVINTGLNNLLSLFSPPAEYERIAPFKPCNNLYLLRFFNNELIYLFLLQCIGSALFSYVYYFCSLTGILQKSLVCQIIIHNHIRLFYTLYCLKCNKSGGPRTCANKIYNAFSHTIP